MRSNNSPDLTGFFPRNYSRISRLTLPRPIDHMPLSGTTSKIAWTLLIHLRMKKRCDSI
jgi:hypothetical protein